MSCSSASAADSPECRRWQGRYEGAAMIDGENGNLTALIRSKLLEKRPEGCEIP